MTNKKQIFTKKLSEYIKKWRSDRPDEWVMDDFIKQAQELEKTNEQSKEKLLKEFYNYVMDEWGCNLREEQIHLFLHKD